MVELSGGCPFRQGKNLDIGNQYRPFEQEGMHDFFKMAQVEAPVTYNEQLGYYIVTNRRDVMKILRNVKKFSASIALEPITPVTEEAKEYLANNGYNPIPSQVNVDKPNHTRIRKLVTPIFDRKSVAKLSHVISNFVDEAIQGFGEKKTIDLIDDFSYELPARVVCHMLGVDDKDIPNIKKWADNRLLFMFGELNHEEQMEAVKNITLFWNFCADLVNDRIKNPQDDYASYLLEKRSGNDEVITVQEIISLTFGLLLAGHETTTNMIANGIYTLLSNRDSWVDICNDHSLIPNAIEELLRINGSVVCWRRKALEDYEINGGIIPKGSKVLVSLVAGNLDDGEFENPSKFDIYRRNAERHITFGHGIHVCIGADIAREEMKVVLEKLTAKFPNMALSSDKPLDYIKTITFRGPKHLMVDLNR